MKTVRIGIEEFAVNPPKKIKNIRLGLLANPASIDSRLQHCRHIIGRTFPGQLRALFSPQHGFFAEKQDNMIASDNIANSDLGIPVYSLYGETRTPTPEMLAGIDALIIDLQDVGTRVYTFIYTMALAMQAARSAGIQVIVLDRPNPIGGVAVEGNTLQKDFTSFVGLYPIPMRHGLTLGELALLFNEHFEIGCDLSVIPMVGWSRDMYFEDTGLPWVAPSPNMPTPSSAMVYPGQVIWEGTNVSEGRGTTQPFEIFGAPFVNTGKVLSKMLPKSCGGVYLRPLAFEPTYNKWKGTLCYGFQLHVTDQVRYKPFTTSIALLEAIFSCHPGLFQWTRPPYEYEYDKVPFDVIMGTPEIRQTIESGASLADLEIQWADEARDFDQLRRPYLLYNE